MSYIYCIAPPRGIEKLKQNHENCGMKHALLATHVWQSRFGRSSWGSAPGLPHHPPGITPCLLTVPQQSQANQGLTPKVHKLELIFYKMGQKIETTKEKPERMHLLPPLPFSEHFISTPPTAASASKPDLSQTPVMQ